MRRKAYAACWHLIWFFCCFVFKLLVCWNKKWEINANSSSREWIRRCFYYLFGSSNVNSKKKSRESRSIHPDSTYALLETKLTWVNLWTSITETSYNGNILCFTKAISRFYCQKLDFDLSFFFSYFLAK